MRAKFALIERQTAGFLTTVEDQRSAPRNRIRLVAQEQAESVSREEVDTVSMVSP